MDVKKILKKKSLTATDKDAILVEAEFLGLDAEINSGCNDCYRDLLIQIGVKQNENQIATGHEVVVDEKDILQNWKLKDGVDIYFGISRVRVNAETINSKIADKLFKAWGEKYFDKI